VVTVLRFVFLARYVTKMSEKKTRNCCVNMFFTWHASWNGPRVNHHELTRRYPVQTSDQWRPNRLKVCITQDWYNKIDLTNQSARRIRLVIKCYFSDMAQCFRFSQAHLEMLTTFIRVDSISISKGLWRGGLVAA
jgi:hypothetical protein